MATNNEVKPVESSSLALNAVLSNAVDMGVDAALQQFGGPLTETEKALVRNLSKEDLVALRQISTKLGRMPLAAAAANNNINDGNNNIKP